MIIDEVVDMKYLPKTLKAIQERKCEMKNEKEAAFYGLINYLISESYGVKQFKVLQKFAGLLNYSDKIEAAVIQAADDLERRAMSSTPDCYLPGIYSPFKYTNLKSEIPPFNCPCSFIPLKKSNTDKTKMPPFTFVPLVSDEIAFQPGNSAWVLLKTQRRKFKHCPCCHNTRTIKVKGYTAEWLTCPECVGKDLYENVDVWYARKGLIKVRATNLGRWKVRYEIKIKNSEKLITYTKLFRTKKAARAECARRNKPTSSNEPAPYEKGDSVWILKATQKRSSCKIIAWYIQEAKITKHYNDVTAQIKGQIKPVYLVSTYSENPIDQFRGYKSIELPETDIFKFYVDADTECARRNRAIND